MPNWCYNTLTITGFTQDQPQIIVKDSSTLPIDRFESLFQTEFDFNVFIPEPDENNPPAEFTNEDGSFDWYSWRISHWGTKWNASDMDCHVEEGDTLITRIRTYDLKTSARLLFGNPTSTDRCLGCQKPINTGTFCKPCDELPPITQEVIEKSKILIYTFSTAWSPPLPILHAMHDKFPELNILLEAQSENHDYLSQFGYENGEYFDRDIDCDCDYHVLERKMNSQLKWKVTFRLTTFRIIPNRLRLYFLERFYDRLDNQLD